MGLKWKSGVILLTVLLSFSPAKVNAASVGDISKQLICPCSCTLILSNCDCPTQEEMVASIEQTLAQGQSEEQIIQFFVAQYGEQVLVSPPKRGFSGATWALLFVAMLGGGGVIYIARKKKARRSKQSPAPGQAKEKRR